MIKLVLILILAILKIECLDCPNHVWTDDIFVNVNETKVKRRAYWHKHFFIDRYLSWIGCLASEPRLSSRMTPNFLTRVLAPFDKIQSSSRNPSS